MAPRKKKGKKVSSVPAASANKSKAKGNAKKVVKPQNVKKLVTKAKPIKKVTSKKAKVIKKPPIIKSNENFEKFVENIIETKGDKLLSNLSENLDNSSTESHEYSSVECDTSMESHTIENEDSRTCEITEQLENLDVQEEQSDLVEIIEFDSIDNVVTVDYVSQEETIYMENDNSNVSDLVLPGSEIANISKHEEVGINHNSNLNNAINEVEQNLSILMCDTEECLHPNDIQPKDFDTTRVKINDNDENNVKTTRKNKIEAVDEHKECISTEIESVKSEYPLDTNSKLEVEVKTEDNETNSEIELPSDADKIEKSSKNKNRKQIDIKTQKSQKKESKKKEKSKPSKAKSALKNKVEEIDDSSIRRSSRIKSISVLKKPSVGHGLVKMKEFETIEMKTEFEKVQVLQSLTSTHDPKEKPIKVKSRWRRSSELEMNVSNTALIQNANLHIDENICSNSESDKSHLPLKDEMVENRLKQFIHLKENSYLTERFICKEAKKMTCDCFLTEEEIERGEMACGEDCLNRLLMIECGNLCQVADRCVNKKFQKGQFAPVEVFNTHKKGLGLRAAANIPYGEFILEYVGEVLNATEFDKRAEEYSLDKNQHYYFMSLRADAIIDATQKGNISRFINHSCEPNAETQKWTVNGELRIGFFSTRTILAGEEVTFDYRFERYGKEAQKCFCEAPSCRGWLGEEPEEDEEEDEDEDELEEVVEDKPVEDDKEKLETVVVATEQDSVIEVKLEEATPVEIVPKKKKSTPRRKLRKELFEDDQLDEEIEVLITTGLKNQAHTLKLSRLMLRAKEPSQRAKLLKVLRRGELPCRRLFLDYHGLRLMHGYMTDAQYLCKNDKKYDSLRLEMLQTLAVLPIPNKSMLQDSKVLPTVEKWSIPLSSESPIDSESNSPKTEAETSQSPIPIPLIVNSKETTSKAIEENTFDENQSLDCIRKSVGMIEVKTEYSYFTNTSGTALAEEIANIFEDDAYISSPKIKPIEIKPQLPNYEEEIGALASKLLEAWSNLKEVFRIPKKERIEQMKEHEREANKGYIAGLGLEQYAEKKNESRYRGIQRSRQQDKKNFKPEERSHQQVMLSKHNRRKLFALQVEHQEEERRRKQRELWRQHERNCMLVGTDPRFTAPFDPTRGYQCIWNPQIGQWQNYPLTSENQSSVGYGHMPNIPVQTTLLNTNVPPPHITPTTNYGYALAPMQMPNGMPLAISPISTNRTHTHMVSPMSVGRPPLPATAPPPLPHQIKPTNVSTMTPNILHTQAIPTIPTINTSMPPPPTVPQTPPPLPTGIPTLYQTAGYSPQIVTGQTQSPVLYQQEKKKEVISMIGDVKFLGPIPPSPKLPPKWKCAKDRYGRPYYYHIRVRKSQWEPPLYEMPPLEPDESSESSSSDSTSSSSGSSSDDSDSDDEIINDSRLLKQVRKHMDKQFKVVTPTKKTTPKNISLNIKDSSSSIGDSKSELEVSSPQAGKAEIESSIDKRLKEQFNLLNDDTPPSKRKRCSLVQEIIISPRSENDKLQFREDLKRYKENKEMLKKKKELILQQSKKQMKEKKLKQQLSKAKLREMKYSNSENAKKIKETFRSSMANTVVSALNAYRKSDCKEGRITNNDDFKHLARKLTHFVMLKEMKYISEIDELVCSDNVKAKARDYIRKYMSKFGDVYIKRDDEPEHYY